MAHLVRATREYKDGRLKVEYWCGKIQVVPADEPYDIDKARPPRPTDCPKCRKAKGI